MRLVEPLAVAIVTWRRIGTVPLALRAIVAVGSITALLATSLPAWDVPDGYAVVAALFAIVWTLAPDSHAGLGFVGMLAMGRLTGAPGDLDAAAIVTALALLMAHVAAALAASMPVTARADPRLVLQWARPTAGIAVAVVGAAGVLTGFDAWSPDGSLVITLSALVLVMVAAWWWSAPPGRDPSGQSRLRTAHRSGNSGVNSVERR